MLLLPSFFCRYRSSSFLFSTSTRALNRGLHDQRKKNAIEASEGRPRNERSPPRNCVRLKFLVRQRRTTTTGNVEDSRPRLPAFAPFRFRQHRKRRTRERARPSHLHDLGQLLLAGLELVELPRLGTTHRHPPELEDGRRAEAHEDGHRHGDGDGVVSRRVFRSARGCARETRNREGKPKDGK